MNIQLKSVFKRSVLETERWFLQKVPYKEEKAEGSSPRNTKSTQPFKFFKQFSRLVKRNGGLQFKLNRGILYNKLYEAEQLYRMLFTGCS